MCNLVQTVIFRMHTTNCENVASAVRWRTNSTSVLHICAKHQHQFSINIELIYKKYRNSNAHLCLSECSGKHGWMCFMQIAAYAS